MDSLQTDRQHILSGQFIVNLGTPIVDQCSIIFKRDMAASETMANRNFLCRTEQRNIELNHYYFKGGIRKTDRLEITRGGSQSVLCTTPPQRKEEHLHWRWPYEEPFPLPRSSAVCAFPRSQSLPLQTIQWLSARFCSTRRACFQSIPHPKGRTRKLWVTNASRIQQNLPYLVNGETTTNSTESKRPLDLTCLCRAPTCEH